MPTVQTCPVCGAELPGGSAKEQCIQCLLQLGLEPSHRNAGEELGDSGESFGDYLLQGEIARGGMGVVYKARQRSLKRVVALKQILRGSLASEEEVRRFRTEAEAAATLSHPHIVPIYEIGEHGGQQYFTMELIEGGNLAGNVQQYRADLKAAAILVVQIARAIEYAHQRGVLHRDIKPSNILIDSYGKPHVTDFGLARRLEQDSSLTQTGAFLGTPNYMAPEVASGQAKLATTTADVWSLGIVLYQLLTGRLPFEGATALVTARQVVETEPRAPSTLDARVDCDLETICLRCLEKEPARRYSSAATLADELERWLRHEPIHARPSTLWGRTAKWAKRRPASAALIAVSLGAIATIFILTLFKNAQLKAEAREAELRRAESLLQDGNALAAVNRFAEAKDRLNQSRGISLETRTSPLSAELSLMEVYRVSPPPLLTLTGHVGKVTCVACGIDQHTLFSGGQDGTIRIWSFPMGRLEATVNAHADGVECLVISPDGNYCVSGGMDQQIRIWDARRIPLAPLKTLASHKSRVSSVAFSQQGDLFASASWDRTIQVWKISSSNTVERVRKIRTDQNQISSIGFTPGPPRIFAASKDKGLQLWNLDDLEHPTPFPAYPGALRVACSREGTVVLAGQLPGGISLLDTASGETMKAWWTESPVTAVAFSSHGGRLVSGASDGNVSIWDVPSPLKDPLVVLSEHQDLVAGLAMFADQRLAVSASYDGTLRVWDTNPGQEVPTFTEKSSFVSRAVFSSDGQLIAIAGNEGKLSLRDAADGELLVSYIGHSNLVVDVALSSDGKRIASAGEDGTVRIWDLETAKELHLFRTPGKTVSSVVFSPDGKLLLGGEGSSTNLDSKSSGSLEPVIHVWETEAGREINKLTGHSGGVLTMGFSADAGEFWSVGGEGKGFRWKTSTWQRINTLDLDTNGVTRAALGHDATLCAVIGDREGMMVWDLISGQKLHSFGNFKEQPSCIAISADGSMLLSGMNNAHMRLWDLVSDREIHTFFTWHDGPLSSVSFAPDGRTVISSGRNQVKLWDLRRASTYSRLQAGAIKAQAILETNRGEHTSLETLGEWYAFRGIWGYAAQLFDDARRYGGDVPFYSLAQCYWQEGQLGKAQDVLREAAGQSGKTAQRVRLRLRAVAEQIAHRDSARAGLVHTNAMKSKGDSAAKLTQQRISVLQPGPLEAKDIWTTSSFSYGPRANVRSRKSLLNPRWSVRSEETGGGILGGGSDDETLRVGGWGDWYYSLLQFDLTGQPIKAMSAALCLFCFHTDGGGTPLFLDRITEPWDWKHDGTGRDHDRLWWADRPTVSPWTPDPLPTAIPGQWYSIDITDLYNAWQSGTYSNYGVQLRPMVNTNANFISFYGADFLTEPTLRPKLVIKAVN
jgi:WD40 repeat protein/tRNA A-37 threonylcarbamoyl transferase component Bud32